MGLFDNFTILASTEETPGRLKEVWWKFRRIDLMPLTSADSKILIKYLTAGLTIPDYQLLETRIMSFANGNPLAMVEMVAQVHHLKVVNVDDIRTLYHEAGVRYRDWTPLVIVLWTVGTSSRFFSLGAGSYEGYLFAFLGLAVSAGVLKYLRSR